MGNWSKNAAGVKDGAQCYRNINGKRWEWFAEDIEQLRAVGARCRKSPGGGCFVHPDDAGGAMSALATTPSPDASPDSGEVILAWLEQQVRASATGVSFDYEPSGFRFMRHHHIGEPCKSIAEAIRQDGGPARPSVSPANVKEAGEAEWAHLAAWRAIYGDGDPFLNPEGFDYCCKIADAVLAALSASNAAQVSK